LLKKSSKKISVLKLSDIVRARIPAGASDDDVELLCRSAFFETFESLLLDFDQCRKTIRRMYCTLRCELEILQDLADDVSVTEIMVNGPEEIFAERNGKLMRTEIAFESREQLERIIQRLAARVGREMNDMNPIVDARLSDGSRINAVHSNIAINGPVLTIRRFNKSRTTIEDLIAQGDISSEGAELMKKLVCSGYNIFVSGGTSSGKTTFLNILSDFIPPDERVIVIEDSAELQIRSHENLVRMESKAANAQGKGEVSIRDLIRSSLRMRPDRIIVGEVRGVEVIDMISAMSTGHDGSLSTGHSNSARGMIRRLETLYLAESNFPIDAVQAQIAEALEIIVHLRRDSDGHRRVSEIVEFLGYENSQPILNRLYPEKGQLRRKEKLLRIYPED